AVQGHRAVVDTPHGRMRPAKKGIGADVQGDGILYCCACETLGRPGWRTACSTPLPASDTAPVVAVVGAGQAGPSSAVRRTRGLGPHPLWGPRGCDVRTGRHPPNLRHHVRIASYDTTTPRTT